MTNSWTMKNAVSKELLSRYTDAQLTAINGVFLALEEMYGYRSMVNVDKDVLNAYAIREFNLPSEKKGNYIAYSSYSVHCATRSGHGRMYLNGWYNCELVASLLDKAGLRWVPAATTGFIEVSLVPDECGIRKMLIDEWLDENKD